MKNVANMPWMAIKTDAGSYIVEDADGYTLCQMLEWKGRSRQQAAEHAVLFSVSFEAVEVLKNLVGAAAAAVQSGRTEYEGVAAYWAKIGPDARRVLRLLEKQPVPLTAKDEGHNDQVVRPAACGRSEPTPGYAAGGNGERK